MKNLKAILYALLTPAVIMGIVLLTPQHKLEWNMLYSYGMLVLCFLIFFVRNEAGVQYIWRGVWPDWVSTGQLWLGVLGINMFVFPSIFMWEMPSGPLRYALVPVLLGGAFLFRYAYTRNAPEDLDAYVKEHKYEEDPDALVTVAECNDSSSAHIIRSMLESNGIETEIFGDGLADTLGVARHSMPIRVLVRKRDKENAERLINE